jgi:cobalt-zinc-cadmium resistance protein CzcA
MMTATIAALGLIPFLFSKGPGAEVQKPLAVVVIGGLITSTFLTLVVIPVLYRYFEGRERNAPPSPPVRTGELVTH